MARENGKNGTMVSRIRLSIRSPCLSIDEFPYPDSIGGCVERKYHRGNRADKRID